MIIEICLFVIIQLDPQSLIHLNGGHRSNKNEVKLYVQKML